MRPRRHDYQAEAASICGTDLHLFEEDPAYPVILGHELCGRVVEMEPDAAKSMRCYTGEVKLGDRICLYPWVVCGTCENCLTYGIGASRCLRQFVRLRVPYESLGFGGAPIRSNSIYEAPYIKGGFGEIYVMFSPAPSCGRCLMICPAMLCRCLIRMAVAMRGVELAMRAPGIFEDSFNLGSTALVIGDGQIAALWRHCPPWASSTHHQRFQRSELQLAKELSGADEVMNSSKLSIEERRAIIHKYKPQERLDAVFQCAGSQYAFRDGVDLLKNVGTLVEIGNIGTGKPVEFYPGKDLRGKHATYIGMSVNTAKTFDKAFQMLLKHKQLGLERIFSHRATLDTLGEAMSHGKDLGLYEGLAGF